MTNALYTSPTLALWRDAAGHAWSDYIDHEFVQGLGNGNLAEANFHSYLIQDYIFLVHFTRAWAMAVVKSETLDEMKIAASTVDALVNHEMQLHVETCKKIGISEEQLYSAEEAFENLAYTRFVMDTALSGDFLDLMAALAPCIFGYGVIGAKLAKTASPDTPYQEWIDTYAGEEYQGLCDTLGALVENAAQSRLGDSPQANPRWQSLCSRFLTATKLETAFWGMGLRAE